MKHKINTGIGHLVHQYQKQGIHFNLTAVAEQFKFVSQSVSQSVSQCAVPELWRRRQSRLPPPVFLSSS